jgi:hypothetical protein
MMTATRMPLLGAAGASGIINLDPGQATTVDLILSTFKTQGLAVLSVREQPDGAELLFTEPAFQFRQPLLLAALVGAVGVTAGVFIGRALK